jgi:2-oxo-hept-3-ene-1,7-dioate hydratase
VSPSGGEVVGLDRGPTRALSDGLVADAARRLAEAEQTGIPMPQLSLQYPEMTVEDAYAVQRCFVEAKVANGRSLVGHKIGLTSKAMQQAMSIDQPDFGALLDDMIF